MSHSGKFLFIKGCLTLMTSGDLGKYAFSTPTRRHDMDD